MPATKYLLLLKMQLAVNKHWPVVSDWPMIADLNVVEE